MKTESVTVGRSPTQSDGFEGLRDRLRDMAKAVAGNEME